MRILWNFLALSFSALLPLVNPFGSAFLFLGLVGSAPIELYRKLARRIAINTVLFLVIVDLLGSAILRFFGISLPIVQVAGGLVIAAIAWGLLNQHSSEPSPEKLQGAAQMRPEDLAGNLMQKSFYPFTFPITAGPGCIVVTLTLTAQIPQRPIPDLLLAHAGLVLAIVLLAAITAFCYAYAPVIASHISPSTAHGILRVIAFILLCIGVQIAWNGLSPLLTSLLHRA
jgi:multiple antibiotic resistance protein